MEERSDHLTVVIGASSVAEELRRSLVQFGAAHAGVTTHLRGLRRSMVLPNKKDELVVVCVSLDRATLDRHGKAVRRLLAEHHTSPRGVRSVGLLTGMGLTREVAEMGFDVLVANCDQAIRAVRLLSRKWRATRRRLAAEARLLRSQRMKEITQTDVWNWGIELSPDQFESSFSNRPARHDSSARRSAPPSRPAQPPSSD